MARAKSRGFYRLTFTFDGHRYEVRAKCQKDLPQKKVAKLQELQEGKQNHDNPRLDDYYTAFTKIRSHTVKDSTIRSQKIQYKAIADTEIAKGITFGSMRIRDIKRRDIENVREIMLENGKTPQYLNNCFGHLNHVFNAAVLDETIQNNPCKQLKQLKREDPLITDDRHGKHRALSIAETEKFFTAAEERHSYYTNIFKIMIKTGMRVGEVTALYPTDIDRKNGFIHVRRTVTRNTAGGYEVGKGTKTESGARDIPLTDEVYQIFNDQRKQNIMFFGTDSIGLLFRSFDNKIIREYTLNREVGRICKATGIEYFTCHAFRATYATRFIEQRPEDYKTLSEVLGHKNISITLNLYTHVMQARKIAAVKAVHVNTGFSEIKQA